jgi:hypothetical protein
MAELWRTSLSRLQNRFIEAAESSGCLGCVLIESFLNDQSRLVSPSIPDFRGRQQVRFEGSCYRRGASLGRHAQSKSKAKRGHGPRKPDENTQWLGEDGKPLKENPALPSRGLFRQVQFWGDPKTDTAYRRLARDAGNCVPERLLTVSQLVPVETMKTADAGLRWTYLLFDLAENGGEGCPVRLLREKSVYFHGHTIPLSQLPSVAGGTIEPSTQPRVGEQGADLADRIPSDPEQWYSALDDVVNASVAAIDVLLALTDIDAGKEGGTEDNKDSHILERLNSEIPTLDDTSEDWISNKAAAKLLGSRTETIANHRHSGLKAEGDDEAYGLHDKYCFWRKQGRKHPRYYLPLMKQHAGHLVKIFPKSSLDSLDNRH